VNLRLIIKKIAFCISAIFVELLNRSRK